VRALIMESVGVAKDDAKDGANAQRAHFIDATTLATALMGDSIAANLFMLGFAYQKGRIPLTEASLLRAIELNGVGIASNKKSFLWGRRAAVDFKRVEHIATPGKAIVVQMPQSLDTIIKQRIAYLTAYQNAEYAATYEALVKRVRTAETGLGQGTRLSTAVAKYYFKLMAYKDEYEVARLYTDGRFVEQLKQQFEGSFSVKFNMAPPLFSKKDAQGHLVKAEFGSWMWHAFKLLAKCKGLRGGTFDIFGYSDERKMERALVPEYREMIVALLPGLNAGNLAQAVALANLPEQIRGFGHVKEQAVAAFRVEKARLLDGATQATRNAA
jgi:indolepyruvate ferredoxin oxidoreductase